MNLEQNFSMAIRHRAQECKNLIDDAAKKDAAVYRVQTHVTPILEGCINGTITPPAGISSGIGNLFGEDSPILHRQDIINSWCAFEMLARKSSAENLIDQWAIHVQGNARIKIEGILQIVDRHLTINFNKKSEEDPFRNLYGEKIIAAMLDPMEYRELAIKQISYLDPVTDKDMFNELKKIPALLVIALSSLENMSNLSRIYFEKAQQQDEKFGREFSFSLDDL